MKKFFTTTFACVLGTLIAGMILILVGVFSLTGILAASASGDTTYTPQKNTVLKLTLSGALDERYSDDPLQGILSQGEAATGLDQIRKAIKVAAENDNVTGIFIDARGMAQMPASSEEIRRLLADFKEETGKWIYAYADNYTQSDYLIASVADTVVLNNIGTVDIHGLGGLQMFLPGLLEKVGVEFQIFRVGTYKSAVEPYICEKMSDANREQTMAYLNTIWDYYTEAITTSRGITPETKAGVESDKEINFATVGELASVAAPKNKSKNIVALVYAVGDITEAGGQGINSEELVPELTKIRKDENVKAVVLRVNSPGGSGYASEQIWAEIEAIKAAGKKVIVSMGDMAASGGYYISCNADRIFANPTTLTGSIGIYGMIPNFGGLVTGKLGVTFDGVQTNRYGNFGAFNRAMTPDERNQMQLYIERGYELFTSRCAEGRGMSLEAIKKIAEGRVWDGQTALKIGLVDELGDLDAAVAWAARKANLEKYKTNAYPAQKTAMEQLLSELNSNVRTRIAASYLGENYKYIQALEQCKNIDPIQYRMEDIELY